MTRRMPVYLDNHATTRLDPRVLDAMMPFLQEQYGNPASRAHEYGWTAEAAVNVARAQVARLIGAEAAEIVFTSGATESINLAIKGTAEGLFQRSRRPGYQVITAATEHRAVLDACHRLEDFGFRVVVLPVDEFGRVSPDAIARAITDDTVLVSIMWANNEIGTIAPLEEIAALCRGRGVLFHTDATQAAGRIPVDLRSVPADLVSFSAHKMYGPKGIGALYIRPHTPRIPLAAQIDGGGHERGLRSGTLNVAGIVGFGKAAELAVQEMTEENSRIADLRDRLVAGIQLHLGDTIVNGHPVGKLPHNASVTFPGRRADALMMAMKDIAVSSGSACSSAQPGDSHVLHAIGLSASESKGTLRFGLGRFTTREEIDYAVRRVVETAHGLKAKALSVEESPHVPALSRAEELPRPLP
jgi:cysteine desulfurase